MSFQYQNELNYIKQKVLEAAKLLSGAFDVREKSPRDVVTSHDLAVENFLTEAITTLYPEDIIISEESNKTVREGHRAWVIDPIDGTTNYSRGIPLYGIQLAFVVDQITTFSLIYYVPMDELYVAILNGGAFCNDRPISVGRQTSLEQAVITLGDFSVTNAFRNDRMLALIHGLMHQVYKLKIHGTACLDMTFVATGRTDVHIMSAHHPWDFLPGLLLVKEAGGVVDTSLLQGIGETRTLMVVASTKSLYNRLNQLL